MDPLTHAVVGLVLGSQAGGSLSVQNGPLVAAAVGAVAPDLDIIAQFWGDLVYLKQHRGFSHSLPGLCLIGIVVGGVLSLLYPAFNFFTLFGWALLGALSHTFLDLFNSYGVQVLWPLSRKKWTANLLMIFDPVLMLISIAIIFYRQNAMYNLLLGILPVLYLLLRGFMRYWAWSLVYNHLRKKYPAVKVTIMPSLRNLIKWDFIGRVPGQDIVGSVHLFKKSLKIEEQLYSQQAAVNRVFRESALGRFFQEFTPFVHLNCWKEENQFIGHFVDLRYRVKGRFLHNATMILDENMNIKEAVFQPFSPSRRIILNQQE